MLRRPDTYCMLLVAACRCYLTKTESSLLFMVSRTMATMQFAIAKTEAILANSAEGIKELGVILTVRNCCF